MSKDNRDAQLLEQLEGYKDNEQALSNKRLYLYFTQMAKCAYCGQPLHIERLGTGDYDVDHIIPRSYLKDDSLRNNLVLVHREENETKGNTYPLPAQMRSTQMQQDWRMWQSCGLINKEKLSRLERSSELTESDKQDFVARQLVETSQAVKLVRDLLKLFLPDTEIALAKAGVSSDFRREMVEFAKDSDGHVQKDADGRPVVCRLLKPEYVKCRELNDFHHAKDAYLAIVTGNVLHSKFTSDPRRWFAGRGDGGSSGGISNSRNDIGREQNNLSRIFWHEQHAFGSGAVVWNTNAMLDTVNFHMGRDDVLVTQRTFMKTAGQNGGFYDQNIISKHAGSDSLIPLKSDDTRFADTGSYGGYRTLTNSHFVLLRFADRHGKECRKIVPVPLLYKDSNKALHAYLAQNSAANYELLCEIPFKSLLKVDGYPVYVDGSSSGLLVSNAKQLALDVDKTVVLKNGLKLLEKRKKDKNYTVTPYDGVDEDSNLVLFRHFVGCMLGGYAKRPSIDAPLAVISTPNAEQCFAKMSIPEQIEVLVDISRLFRRVASSSSCVDLRPFGDARSMSGSTSVPLALNSSKTYKLIRQSVTGLLEKELDLWELSGDSKPDATRSYTQPVLSDVGSAVVTTASATANAVSGTAYDDTAANTAANKTADVVA